MGEQFVQIIEFPPEIGGAIGPAAAAAVIADDGEVPAQLGDLAGPHPAVQGPAMDKHQGRSVAFNIIGNPAVVPCFKLHCRLRLFSR